jgi:hypothetical protein
MKAGPPPTDDHLPATGSHAGMGTLWGVRHPVAQSALLCALYFIAAKLSVHLTLTPGGVSLLWLPNAVILSALLVSDVRRWPWILAAVIPAEVAADWELISLPAALGFGIVNLCEALLAASALRRLHGREFTLERGRHVASFCIVALLVAPGLAALVGSAGWPGGWATQRGCWYLHRRCTHCGPPIMRASAADGPACAHCRVWQPSPESR